MHNMLSAFVMLLSACQLLDTVLAVNMVNLVRHFVKVFLVLTAASL